MVHDTGDVIRPGDCVLLRAGSKKNELPYVAKVASLWENPEDGTFLLYSECVRSQSFNETAFDMFR